MATLCPQKPPPAELSSTPWAPLPTAIQLKSPSTVPVGGVVALGATALAANTISLLFSPTLLAFCSYQTTQGTESFGPVNAMSGSMPSRVRSTFSDGSPPSRSTPTCWKQNPPTGGAAGVSAAGVTPTQFSLQPGPIGFSTKIWFLPVPGALAPISCQVTHGPGPAGLAVEPPATTGFSASSFVWMFSEGT